MEAPGTQQGGSRISGRLVAARMITPAWVSKPSSSARSRLGEQGLPGPGRPDEEHALRDLAAESAVSLGILQKIDDLHQLGPSLVDARDVVEGDPGLVLDVHFRPALADRDQPALRVHPLHDDHPEPKELAQPSRTCYLGKAGAEPTFPSCRLGQRFSMLTGTPSFALVSPSNLPVVVRFSDFW